MTIPELSFFLQCRNLHIPWMADKAALVGVLVENDAVISGGQAWHLYKGWMDQQRLPPIDAQDDPIDQPIERILLNSDYAILSDHQIQQRCHQRQLPPPEDRASGIRQLLFHDRQIAPLAATFWLRPLSYPEYVMYFPHEDLSWICYNNQIPHEGSILELASRLADRWGLIWDGIVRGTKRDQASQTWMLG